MIWLHEDRGNK